MGSLKDIWGKIVAQLTPMGTQVLMRQHGQLLACDGVNAQVGITNDKLMRMAQDRLSNVETAFEKTFGHAIRVTMVVVAAPADQARPAPAAKPAPPIAPPPPPPVRAVQPTKTAPSQPGQAPGQTPEPAQNGAVKWQSESELDRSVKSFAQFFSGQIVNLDDELSASNPVSAEPGPDVPF